LAFFAGFMPGWHKLFDGIRDVPYKKHTSTCNFFEQQLAVNKSTVFL